MKVVSLPLAALLAATLPSTISALDTLAQDPLRTYGGALHPQHEGKSLELLEKYPLIDTHIDLASTIRVLSRRPMEAIDELGVKFPGPPSSILLSFCGQADSSPFPGHFDLPRAKQGGVAGVFLTANAPCPASSLSLAVVSISPTAPPTDMPCRPCHSRTRPWS